MKNYKVKVIRKAPFTDVADNVLRKNGDEFCCTKERYEYLKENNAVELIEIIVTKAKETEVKKDEKKVKKAKK